LFYFILFDIIIQQYQMSLITIFSNLPIEIAHIICLFTGKFVLDKNKKLHSVVNLFDFENIKLHIDQSTRYMNGFYNIIDRQRFVRMLYTKKNGVMSDKKRMNEELSLAQFADYNRHPLLFTKESPIKDVFVQLEKDIFCDTCKYNLSSVDLACPKSVKKMIGYIEGHQIPIYIYYMYRYINMRGPKNGKLFLSKKIRCHHCTKPISKKKDEPVTIGEYYTSLNDKKKGYSYPKLYNNRNMRVRSGVGRR